LLFARSIVLLLLNQLIKLTTD